MGILSRFRDVMKANMNALLDRAEDPEKTIAEYMRSLNGDLGKVKAETASVLSEERRAKRALDESGAEMKKLQRYAEKAAEAGNDEDALKFLERKAKQAEKHAELQAAYDRASANAASMKQMQDKLVSDMDQLESRRAELKGKLAAAKIQHSSPGGVHSAFHAMEEKADRALNEALALAELRAEAKEDDLDELIAQLQKNAAGGDASAVASPEDELAAIKEKMKKKE
ncbi:MULTISPECIES: PspA/IM30 family protein [unclassified Paenibacillus]|uniref:PspA/IM30 family protein n=1 Tax=unclassified Paenibacillus TaxID=185978 RepID=UPI001C122B81|nr:MULTISPECIES: PspA/IM30 family protein [unclassified Paenibacillus]MBU5444465.1 PspA/IM30 family protein [Paenibacillus sp. MSJ-34]CAH0121440.1 Phage shock protein A [Paenibacillus sp. CECT 9249]